MPTSVAREIVKAAVHAQVTCLSNSEEELSKRAALVPFLLQDALVEARPHAQPPALAACCHPISLRSLEKTLTGTA